jgi:hypothetical protein
MENDGISWKKMEYHGISWKMMEYHGISWNIGTPGGVPGTNSLTVPVNTELLNLGQDI